MPKVKLELNQGNYVNSDDDGSNQFSFNLFPTFAEQGGSLTATKVERTPGFASFSSGISAGVGNEYGGFIVDKNPSTDVLYANFGDKLYQISTGGAATAQTGTIGGQNFAQMAINNAGIVAIVKGNNQAYFFDTSTSTITQITDATFLALVGSDAIIGVVYLDGTFIFASSTTLIAASLETVNKGRDFNINDFHEPNYKADQIRDLIISDGLMYVISQESVEVYDTTGASAFPLDRVESIILDKGGLTRGRATVINDQIYLIARDQSTPYGVYVIEGNRFRKISTDVIDKILEEEFLDTDPNLTGLDSKLFQMSHNGHVFCCLYLAKNTRRTFVYDVTESSRANHNVWHRRSGLPGNQDYFPRDQVSIYNKELVLGEYIGLNQFSGIATLDSSTDTELTNDVMRYVSANYISNGMDRIKIKEVTFRHKKVATGNLYLHVSTDRGATFDVLNSNSMSDLLVWRRLGQAEDYLFVIANGSTLLTPDSSSNDVTIYDAWVVVE